MSSKKVLILYYSGSGNTKKMAKAIAEAMKSSAMSVTVEDVGKFDISLLPNYDSIVLGSPTYFSNVAWQVKKAIDESIVHLRIPLIPDSRSDLSRTPVPKDDGHLNRSGATLVFSDILPINQVASSFCFFLIDPPFN